MHPMMVVAPQSEVPSTEIVAAEGPLVYHLDPLLSGPGIAVSGDHFGPPPVTPHNNTYIFVFHRLLHSAVARTFSRSMPPIFATEGTASQHPYQPVHFPFGEARTLSSRDNGLWFCSKLSPRCLQAAWRSSKSPPLPATLTATAASSVSTTRGLRNKQGAALWYSQADRRLIGVLGVFCCDRQLPGSVCEVVSAKVATDFSTPARGPIFYAQAFPAVCGCFWHRSGFFL